MEYNNYPYTKSESGQRVYQINQSEWDQIVRQLNYKDSKIEILEEEIEEYKEIYRKEKVKYTYEFIWWTALFIIVSLIFVSCCYHERIIAHRKLDIIEKLGDKGIDTLGITAQEIAHILKN